VVKVVFRETIYFVASSQQGPEMAHRLYMDVHVPLAITEGLRRRGIDVLTSQGDGTARYHDELLLQRATELGRILFSQDEDLLALATSCQSAGRDFTDRGHRREGTRATAFAPK
jgi:hypothetical protein